MQIGCHLSISKGIEASIQEAIEFGGSALQIFISPPQGASPGKPISEEVAENVSQILENTGVFMVVHGKYILNFCRDDVKWQRDALASDLRKASQLGKNIGVVIHQGKNLPILKKTRSQAIQTYVDNIVQVLEETSDLKNPIILENSCQQGNEIGFSLQELSEIWHTFDQKYHARLGFCLDTCHAFVGGMLRFSGDNEVDMFFEKFDLMIGLKYLKVIHFNDSKTPYDGHNDHHHDILHGFITNPTYLPKKAKKKQSAIDLAIVDDQATRGTVEGLKRVVAWAKKYKIPLILETPREMSSCQEQIELLNQWAEEVKSPTTKTKKEIKMIPKKKK